MSWDESNFTLNGNQITFETENNGVGVEYSYDFNSNFSVGAEVLLQRLDVLSDGGGAFNGDVTITQINFVGKYYFATGKYRPYVGIGAGYASFDVRSSTSVILEGNSFDTNAGIEFAFSDRIGLSLAYKRSQISVTNGNNKLKNNYNVLSVGLTIRLSSSRK